MDNHRALIDQATLPSIGTALVEWPALTRIDFSHNKWHFHYSDGTSYETSDPSVSEAMSRIYFTNEGKPNQ